MSTNGLRVHTIGSTTDDGTEGPGRRLMVLIHGYGADEYDLAPLARLYDPAGECFAICPRGPFDLAPYGPGAGWYERDDDGNIDEYGFLASVDAIDAVIDDACAEHQLDRSATVVIGFSQGGAMAVAVSLRATDPPKPRPAAVACMSGMLQQPSTITYGWEAAGESSNFEAPSILVQHGTLDPVVPIERGHHTRDTLTAAGIAHEYAEYPMQHQIVAESVHDLRQWLEPLLGGDS